jgi:hypothetical protein
MVQTRTGARRILPERLTSRPWRQAHRERRFPIPGGRAPTVPATEPYQHPTRGPLRLGKAAPRPDARNLLLARYLLPAALPPVPASVDYSGKVPAFPLFLNNSLGDCTAAAAAHLTQVQTALAGTPVTPSDADVLALYEATSGYDPATGANDTGAVELDVLNHWRQTPLAGHRITAFVSVDPANEDHMRLGCLLFGGLYIGLNLPQTAQPQIGQTWDVLVGAGPAAEPGSWGGHAVSVCSYDATGLTVVTWGALQRCSWSFWRTYCDEVYGVLPDSWGVAGFTLDGFDLAALQADLSALGTAE